MKVTENWIEENRKEERVIKQDRENQNIVKKSILENRNRGGEDQLIAPLGTSSEGRVLSDIRHMCRVMTSHLNTSTLAYKNKKQKIINNKYMLGMVMFSDEYNFYLVVH